MKPKNPVYVLDEIAQDYYSKTIDLAPAILASVEKDRKTRMKSTNKYFIAAPAILLVLALILIAAPDATRAMSRLLGYVPGIGLVEQNTPLRVLAEPVKADRDGITITVAQALLDSEHTVILYQVENLMTSTKPGEEVCALLPSLRLPDGTELEETGSAKGSTWALGYNNRLTYPAIPPGVNEATLTFPCIEQTPKSAAPENWEIPLRFIAAPPDQTVYPLVDLPTPTAAPTAMPPGTPAAADSATDNAAAAPQEPEGKLLTPADIFLSLTGIVPLEDSVILYGSLQPNGEDVRVGMVDSSALHLVDAGGQEIVLEEDTTSERTFLPGSNKLYLAYRTTGIHTPGPATFTIDSVWVDQDVQASFVFDPGANPQPGQTWPLDVDVEVAGQTLRVASVMVDPSGSGLTFIYDPGSEIQSAVLTDLDHPLTSGAGGPGTFGFSYADGLPKEPIQVTVTTIAFEFTGPWQTTVELPAIGTATATVAAPSSRSSAVCLTRDSWKKAIANKQLSLPDGLTGKLAMSFMTEGDYNYQVMATSLDGSDRQVAGYGDWPGLSPDGSTLVYTGQTGLEILDLATNQKTPIAGTTLADRGVIWSPNGEQMAFTRGPSHLIGAPGPYSIWVANADGSNPRQVTPGSDANYAMTWMPTGDRILYTVEKADGAYVRTIDVETGEVVSLFETNYRHSTIALSPDGKQVAFEEMLPGDRYAVYTADLDGSNRRLLTDPSPVVATVPLWSPDGRWIAVGVSDPDANPPLSVLTLIEVDTCQVVPLPHLNGYGYTWTR